MSFSSQTKDELVESCKLGSTEEKRSLLCGITHAAGSMTLGRGGIGLQYITENSSVAALTVRLGRELYSVTVETSISEKERLNAVIKEYYSVIHSCLVQPAECVFHVQPEYALTAVHYYRRLFYRRRSPPAELHKAHTHFAGQVVHAEIARILELFQGLGLARP